MLLALLTACRVNPFKSEGEHKYFSSKEKAIEHYIEDNDVRGSVEVITTKKEETILVTQFRDNTYFVGELKEDDGEFFTAKLSANVHMERGGAWELNSMNGNEYTIFFKKENEPNYKQLSNDEYFVSFVEGQAFDEHSSNHNNAITDIENVKE